MRILVLAPDVFYETRNSNAVHLYELVNNLKDESKIFTVARGKRNTILDNNIYLINELINIHPFRTLTASINSFIKGYQIIKSNEIDIIYERHHIFDLGILLSKLFDIPIVLEINGILTEEAKLTGSYGSALQRVSYIIENYFTRQVDGIIAVTQGIKDDFVNRGVEDDRIYVVENGANTELFRPVDQNEAQKLTGLNSKYRYICFSGKLERWQGVEYLIRVAPMISEKYPEMRFLIVGDGNMKLELKEMAQNLGVADKFIFTGTVPYERVPLYINASSVCIVCKRPLKSGYSPLKLYEYLACSKPVVASNVDGFEFIERIKAGILVDPENKDELERAIERLLNNNDLRKDMGERGRNHIMRNHSWSSVAKRVACICETTLAQYRGKGERSN